MHHSIQKLVVADVVIRQDADGRYSLNDLHRAAGGREFPDGNPIHRPGEFLRLQQTRDLAALIDSERDAGNPASVSTKKGGSGQGSFACKELVYAYAMWISPWFHLKVIRAYDALATGDLDGLPEAMRSQIGGHQRRT